MRTWKTDIDAFDSDETQLVYVFASEFLKVLKIWKNIKQD